MSTSKPFIVAEVSANHLGNYDRAAAIVRAAAEAGADAVKFQTWVHGTMCVDPTALAPSPWTGTLADLYGRAWMPWDWLPPLFTLAKHLGLVPFSSAFDPESVAFLETLGVDRHKVSSFEAVDLPLIRGMAATRKTLIISTGTATPLEVGRACAAATG